MITSVVQLRSFDTKSALCMDFCCGCAAALVHAALAYKNTSLQLSLKVKTFLK